MIKVLYLVSTLKLSGPTNQFYYLVKNLDRKVFTPSIITLSKEPKRTRKTDFVELDISIYSLNLSRVMGVLLMLRKIGKLTEQIEPDLIHTQGIRSDIICGYKLSKRYKTIATLHNYPYEDYLMTYGNIIGKGMAKIHLNALTKIHRPVVVSKSISQRLKSEKGMRIDAIWNGADATIYNLIDGSKKLALRRELGISADKIVFISVGHLSARKNPLMIIKAFQELKSRLDMQLIFLGTGHLEKACKDIASGDQQIDFLGKVDNVHKYLQAADCFISASKSEGLPTSVLEAIGCGIPVILSRIPQHTEIFEGHTCPFPFFEIDGTDDLVGILDNITREKINESRSFYQDIFRKSFSAVKMSANYQKLYNELYQQG